MSRSCFFSLFFISPLFCARMHLHEHLDEKLKGRYWNERCENFLPIILPVNFSLVSFLFHCANCKGKENLVRFSLQNFIGSKCVLH